MFSSPWVQHLVSSFGDTKFSRQEPRVTWMHDRVPQYARYKSMETLKEQIVASFWEVCGFQRAQVRETELKGLEEESPERGHYWLRRERLGSQDRDTVTREMSFWRLSPSSLSGTLGDKWETKSQLSILHGRFCKVFLTFYVFISYVLNPDYRSNAVLSTGYGSNTTRRGSWHLRAKVLVKRTKNQQTRELTGELQIMTSSRKDGRQMTAFSKMWGVCGMLHWRGVVGAEIWQMGGGSEQRIGDREKGARKWGQNPFELQRGNSAHGLPIGTSYFFIF